MSMHDVSLIFVLRPLGDSVNSYLPSLSPTQRVLNIAPLGQLWISNSKTMFSNNFFWKNIIHEKNILDFSFIQTHTFVVFCGDLTVCIGLIDMIETWFLHIDFQKHNSVSNVTKISQSIIQTHIVCYNIII